MGAFIKFDTGVDYDSPDGEPVDLMFGLLVPEECTEERLELLAQLAGAFDDDALRVWTRVVLTAARLDHAPPGMTVALPHPSGE